MFLKERFDSIQTYGQFVDGITGRGLPAVNLADAVVQFGDAVDGVVFDKVVDNAVLGELAFVSGVYRGFREESRPILFGGC